MDKQLKDKPKPPNVGKPYNPKKADRTNKNKCFNCGMAGHYAWKCQKPPICNFCKKIGHTVSNCFQRNGQGQSKVFVPINNPREWTNHPKAIQEKSNKARKGTIMSCLSRWYSEGISLWKTFKGSSLTHVVKWLLRGGVCTWQPIIGEWRFI